MSFTDQKQREVTEEECRAMWGGAPPGVRFRCYLCGHKFRVGDLWRWVYDNDEKGSGFGNFLVCNDCDQTEVRSRWRALCEEWKALSAGRFWIFVDNLRGEE